MSIGPNIIDRHGERPCIPNLYAVAKALAEGRPPTLRSRVTKALAALRRRIAQ
jgi:hypothetical protein